MSAALLMPQNRRPATGAITSSASPSRMHGRNRPGHAPRLAKRLGVLGGFGPPPYALVEQVAEGVHRSGGDHGASVVDPADPIGIPALDERGQREDVVAARNVGPQLVVGEGVTTPDPPPTACHGGPAPADGGYGPALHGRKVERLQAGQFLFGRPLGRPRNAQGQQRHVHRVTVPAQGGRHGPQCVGTDPRIRIDADGPFGVGCPNAGREAGLLSPSGVVEYAKREGKGTGSLCGRHCAILGGVVDHDDLGGAQGLGGEVRGSWGRVSASLRTGSTTVRSSGWPGSAGAVASSVSSVQRPRKPACHCSRCHRWMSSGINRRAQPGFTGASSHGGL